MFEIGGPIFIFAEEEVGSHLRIYIPGKVPGDQPIHSVKWTGIPAQPSREEFKKASNRFYQSLKKEISLKDLPQREIPGYSSNYPYSVTHMYITEIESGLNKLIYIRNDVAHGLKHGLWFPLWKLMEERIGKYDYIQVDLPVLPKVTTEHFIREWFESNQATKQFRERLEIQSQKSCIEALFSDKEVVYRVSHHPFVNQPTKRFRVSLSENTSARQPNDLEMDIIWRQVSSRDIYFLKGLTDTERKQFAYQGASRNNFGFQVHWVQPLSLSGAIHKSNAILIHSDKEELYHYTVQEPLEKFLRQNHDNILALGKSVFIDLHIPYNDYRSTPIKKIRMRPQNRQELNRSLRKAMREREE